MGLVSAHKLGGPKGIGALALTRGLDVEARIRGGGQEMGRRAGTENVIGIAGFGAAAEAAARDLADGVWDAVAEVRNTLEQALEDACPGIILTAKGHPRLPNTVHLIAPGWKGETQVMAMDLQGFAVSAGSGQWGIGRGNNAVEDALTACQGDGDVSDCAIVIQD